MSNHRIQGVIVPMLTPFNKSGSVDLGAIDHLVDHLVGHGVHGLFPAGTTGEGPLLSQEERRMVAEQTVRAVHGRVPVIIHTGALSTRDTLELTSHAHEIGADAAAIIPPYFYRLTDLAFARHVIQVAEAVPDLPIFLYNNPAVTPNLITADMVLALAQQIPNLAGLKDSSGSLETLVECQSRLPEGFVTAVGSDSLILSGIAMGLDGCISGNANVFPELVVALYNATRAADLDTARVLQHRLNQVRRVLKDGRDLSLFKGVLARKGLSLGAVRSPLLQASDAEIDACMEALAEADVAFNPI